MLFWGVVPDRLKDTIIQPLHKNGDRCDVSKYRPVSLLTSFSKIFETLMRKRILKHLTKYNILTLTLLMWRIWWAPNNASKWQMGLNSAFKRLSTEQYGFRLGLRTDNATYKLTTEILNAMNNKLLVGGIFCDLEKAFDCVNHDLLLRELKFYEISD